MKHYSTLKKNIIDILIFWNVSALYFVESFWYKNKKVSLELRISTSLSFILISGVSYFIFLDSYIKWWNWRAVFFFIYIGQIFLGILFKKKIYRATLNFKESIFAKFYWLFLSYFISGAFLLLYLLFSKK